MKKRISLIIILVMAISTFAWLGAGRKRFCSALKASSNGSKVVVLERYYAGTVLQTAKISEDEFKSWVDQLPTGLGRLRYTFSKCWIPHHRIQFDGSPESEVEICFTCDEIWTKATGRRKIPEDWRQTLRSMFRAHEISDAAPDSKEHLQFLDAMIEEAESGIDSKSQVLPHGLDARGVLSSADWTEENVDKFFAGNRGKPIAEILKILGEPRTSKNKSTEIAIHYVIEGRVKNTEIKTEFSGFSLTFENGILTNLGKEWGYQPY